MNLPRTLNPATNGPGLLAAALAITALVTGIGQHAVTQPVIIAALGAVGSLLIRPTTTPIKDPRDGNGTPLKTASAHAADNFARSIEAGARTQVLPEPPQVIVRVDGDMPPDAMARVKQAVTDAVSRAPDPPVLEVNEAGHPTGNYVPPSVTPQEGTAP